MRFLRLSLIVGTLPNTLANGQTADATPLMADLNFIVNQVNANAAPLANTALLNASNSFTQPQGGVSAQAVSQFVIAGDIITGGYDTLTSTLGTNALTARSTQLIPSSLLANQSAFLIPSQTNTGPVSLNRDSLGSHAILQMGSGLRGDELRSGIPTRLFFDGFNYHIVGPTSKASTFYNIRDTIGPVGVMLNLAGPTFQEFSRVGAGPKVAIGALGGIEANVSYNMDYTTSIHRFYDQSQNAFWFTLNQAGFFLQFAPASSMAGDIWTGQGSLINISGDADGNTTWRGRQVLSKVGLTLASGANQNVALPLSDYAFITGAASNFSIGGIVAPAAGILGTQGHMLRLFNNTAFNMTINNNDGGSAVANRIFCRNNTNLALTGVSSSVTLMYESAFTGWIVLGNN